MVLPLFDLSRDFPPASHTATKSACDSSALLVNSQVTTAWYATLPSGSLTALLLHAIHTGTSVQPSLTMMCPAGHLATHASAFQFDWSKLRRRPKMVTIIIASHRACWAAPNQPGDLYFLFAYGFWAINSRTGHTECTSTSTMRDPTSAILGPLRTPR